MRNSFSRLTLLAILFCSSITKPLLARSEPVKPAQPWAGAALTDWSNSTNAIVITDLSRCQPRSALSNMVLKRKRWKLIPYRMLNGYEGKMVWAPPEADAPELSIAPELEGWYAIFVGLFSAPELPTTAWLRLDTDPPSIPRFNSLGDYYGNSEEVFFRAVRLRKESRLLFRPQTTGVVAACGITHVKLIPLTEEEVRRIETEKGSSTNRVLTATSDGFSDMFYRSQRTASALLSQVEIFRDTDFGTLILQSPGADKVNYPTKVGFLKGWQSEMFPRVGDRHFVEATRALAKQKIIPVKALIERAHQLGMQVHVGIRPAGWSFFEPYSDYWESPFYQNNPQWRCEDRDGTPVTRMSWAVPEVRAHLIALLQEQVQFGADGANLVFTRGYPLVLYEPPARQLFQDQHGIDPRQIPESDPLIGSFRSDVVTKFMRELRAMLDQEQQRRGSSQQLASSVIINGTAQDDLNYGVDLRRLVAEKLVDEVFTEQGFGVSSSKLNLEFLREVCQPQGIRFSPGLFYSGTLYPNLPKLYEAGSHGVTFWDVGVGDVFEWCWISRCGHKEETLWRLQNLDLKKAPRTIHFFKKLGNQIRDGRFGPYWGG
ncbi:MAG: hypothetical protein HY298_17610 [Verrucomicrobia bacterium]|nr:hypothetical protein [Verrucomicrobiota bacterium]